MISCLVVSWYTKFNSSSHQAQLYPELGAVVQVEGVDGAAPPAKKPWYSLTSNDVSALLVPLRLRQVLRSLRRQMKVARNLLTKWAVDNAAPTNRRGCHWTLDGKLMLNKLCTWNLCPVPSRSYSSPLKETPILKNTSFNIEAQSLDVVYRYWRSIVDVEKSSMMGFNDIEVFELWYRCFFNIVLRQYRSSRLIYWSSFNIILVWYWRSDLQYWSISELR